MPILDKPDPFLEIKVQEFDGLRGVAGICAGFENEEWRFKALASHLMEWLPEFALDWADLMSLKTSNMVARIKQAAANFYTSENYKSRGEIGELILHVILRQVFDTIPAISKIYFKDSANNTVKGFDAVHVIATESSLELWIGEVKFYKDVSTAIYDVSKELIAHLEESYLRQEFFSINNKIDPNWPYIDRLQRILHRNTSLDDVFDAVCIPVLLTYESELFSSHKKNTAEYKQAFIEEVTEIRKKFNEKNSEIKIKIYLFLVPMKDKVLLLKEFDEILRGMQR